MIFIFMVLARKGPIYLAVVSTSRSLFTVLLSVYSSNATLTTEQKTGIFIVFGYLITEGLYTAWSSSSAPLAQGSPADAKKQA